MATYGLYNKKKTDRIGPPMNERQRLASKENYALFQLTGAIGNLKSLSIGGYYSTTDHAIYYALKHMNEAVRSIKAIQAQRKTDRARSKKP